MSNDTYTISFSAEEGKVYALERAQSLEKDAHWFMVGTLQTGYDGEYTFTICSPAGWSNGFYRVAEVLPVGVQLWEGGPYWAETNLGAAEPWEYGYYFWWGDTVGYVRKGDAWVTSDGAISGFSFSEENTPTYGKDMETLLNEGWITTNDVLAPKYDAAQVQWGGGWRMPTSHELDELWHDKCDRTLTTRNGVVGLLVCGRGNFADSNIFITFAGLGQESLLHSVGNSVFIWSTAVRCGNFDALGWLTSWESTMWFWYNRSLGMSVRPVRYSPNSEKCSNK